jgi:hypothetical protein
VLWVFEALRAVALADVAAGERAVSMARSIEVGDSFEFFRAGSICLEGCVEVMLGNAERGIELLERGSSLYSPNGVRTILPLYLSFGARAHLDLGNLDAAEEWMSRANALLEETGEVWQRPFLLCSTARIARAREEADAETVTALVREAYNTALAQGSFGVAVRVKDAANDLCVSVD